MTNKNNKLLITTLAAYLIYFTQGFFLVLPGALTPMLSKYYGASLTVIGFLFTMMSLTRAVGNFLSGKILPRIRLQRFVLSTTVVVIVMLCSVFLIDNMWVFVVCNMICYFALGAHYALANNLILRLYSGKKRAAVMSIMTFFYSSGAILSPFIFSSLLKINGGWSWIYLIPVVPVASALLSLGSDRGVLAVEHKPDVQPKKLTINRFVLLSTLSIFLYMIADMSFSLWLPVFLSDKLHLSVADAAFSLVLLWSGLAAGRIVIGFIARRFVSHKIIFTLAFLTFLSIILLFTAMTPANYVFIILLLGLGLSGLFSMILAFGNEQSGSPDSRLMNLLTTASAVGGLIGMFASSLMKAFVSADIIILFACVFTLTAVFCVAACLLLKKKDVVHLC